MEMRDWADDVDVDDGTMSVRNHIPLVPFTSLVWGCVGGWGGVVCREL